MIASSYPLLDAFLTMLWIFLFIIWIWLLIIVFADIFRSQDLSGWGKALWVLGIIIIPWLGVLIYLIARGGKMHERQVQAAQAQDQAFRQYVQETAASTSGGSADELAKLADLREKGVISDAEFEAQKAKILAS
jgi:ABC-type multidrug transport system fused ATPase/permease subunit